MYPLKRRYKDDEETNILSARGPWKSDESKRKDCLVVYYYTSYMLTARNRQVCFD